VVGRPEPIDSDLLPGRCWQDAIRSDHTPFHATMHPTAELFTEKAWAAVVAAQQLAQQKRQQQMESEHLFAALLAQEGLANRILEKAGVDVGTLSQPAQPEHRSRQHLSGQGAQQRARSGRFPQEKL
jgi:hypothetical protein